MKHDVLRSIAHNIADSLACGNGFLIGLYQHSNVYEEANRSHSGFITVDFLSGVVTEGSSSESLMEVVRLYRDALAKLCKKHGYSLSDFASLTARYSTNRLGRPQFTVTVKDRHGQTSNTEYGGLDAQRTKRIDSNGRLRPKPVRRS
jgi:hypothetical protein